MGSLGEAIILNGSKGGFLERASRERLNGVLPSSQAERCTLPNASLPDGEDEADTGGVEGGITVPPPNMNISWLSGVKVGNIRGIQVKLQPLPSRQGLRDKLLQPCVFGINRMGDAAAAVGDEGTCGYLFYIISHIVIFGRKHGEQRVPNHILRNRAARIAKGELQVMWEELCVRCGVRAAAKEAAPPTAAKRTPSDKEKLLLAQHWVNQGDPGRAIGVFGASPVGDSLDPSVQRALLDLTPYRDLPSAGVVADEPGTEPISVQNLTIDKVCTHLPSGRARGTLLSSYELIRGTFTAGAKPGWRKFFKAFGAGALSVGLAMLMRALRAVLLDKDGCGLSWRPLGIGEAERRCGSAIVATHKKKGWNAFYTSELPTIKAARLERITAAEHEVEVRKGSVAATASRDEATATAARTALAEAEAAAECARQTPNFPVQLAFAPNGAEILGHTLDGWSMLAPEEDIVGCDTRNMYNECIRDPSFHAMRDHDPESIPVYRMLYGHEAEIYLDRTSTGSMVQLTADEVCARSSRLGVEGLENTVDPDVELLDAAARSELPSIFSSVVRSAAVNVVATIVTLFLASTTGFHQGCALATNGSCLPYQVALAHIQLVHKSTRVVIFGDDTYGGDHGSRLYAWRSDKEKACSPLGHTARHDKEACWSAEGTLEHAPADLPGSPLHPGGRLQGFKGVGCFFGEPDWVRLQLHAKMVKLYGPLDSIDKISDGGGVTNSAQIKFNMIDYSANGWPTYWLRIQRPSLTTVAPCDPQGQPVISDDEQPVPAMSTFIDNRTAQSFEALTHAAVSPLDRRARALLQARLPAKIGGANLPNATDHATADHVASYLACWGRMHQWFPFFSTIDIVRDERPYFADIRDAYNDLRARRTAVAAIYDEYALDLVHYCDGDTTRPRFRPADLATEKSMSPLYCIFDDASAKPPAQRLLASIVHHEGWLAVTAAARQADEDAVTNGTATRRDREATRTIACSQPFASAYLSRLPTSPKARLRTDEYVWALQRRFGLYVTAAMPTFICLSVNAGVEYDLLGDDITNEKKTDKSLPHDCSLRVWHDATQTTATQAVVLGDKEHPDIYEIYNVGCVVDLAEAQMGEGGAISAVRTRSTVTLCQLEPPRHRTPHGAAAHTPLATPRKS